MRIDLEHRPLDTGALLERARANLVEVCERFKVGMLAEFGSHARGDTHPRSDIDLAVVFDREVLPETELEFLGQVTQVCGTDRVDVVNMKKATALLLKEIAIFAKPIYESAPGRLDKLRMTAFGRYFDTEHFRKARSADLTSRFGS
jgi:predicted nucleotidyltransferase